MKVFSVIIIAFLCVSCSRVDTIEKVEVIHIPLYLLTSTAVSDNSINQMSDSKRKIITDQSKLDLINNELTSMKLSSNSYNGFDIRVLARIQYKSGQTDTLRINTTKDAKYKSNIYKSSSELISLLTED